MNFSNLRMINFLAQRQMIFMKCFITFRPTLKTINPTSRTQLKQQLQREQLLQEAERKEAEKRVQQQIQQQQQQQQQQQSTALKVPLQSIGVDVPPQVLQVKFLLNRITRTKN
jgi:hypothetical protein